MADYVTTGSRETLLAALDRMEERETANAYSERSEPTFDHSAFLGDAPLTADLEFEEHTSAKTIRDKVAGAHADALDLKARLSERFVGLEPPKRLKVGEQFDIDGYRELLRTHPVPRLPIISPPSDMHPAGLSEILRNHPQCKSGFLSNIAGYRRDGSIESMIDVARLTGEGEYAQRQRAAVVEARRAIERDLYELYIANNDAIARIRGLATLLSRAEVFDGFADNARKALVEADTLMGRIRGFEDSLGRFNALGAALSAWVTGTWEIVVKPTKDNLLTVMRIFNNDGSIDQERYEPIKMAIKLFMRIVSDEEQLFLRRIFIPDKENIYTQLFYLATHLLRNYDALFHVGGNGPELKPVLNIEDSGINIKVFGKKGGAHAKERVDVFEAKISPEPLEFYEVVMSARDMLRTSTGALEDNLYSASEFVQKKKIEDKKIGAVWLASLVTKVRELSNGTSEDTTNYFADIKRLDDLAAELQTRSERVQIPRKVMIPPGELDSTTKFFKETRAWLLSRDRDFLSGQALASAAALRDIEETRTRMQTYFREWDALSALLDSQPSVEELEEFSPEKVAKKLLPMITEVESAMRNALTMLGSLDPEYRVPKRAPQNWIESALWALTTDARTAGPFSICVSHTLFTNVTLRHPKEWHPAGSAVQSGVVFAMAANELSRFRVRGRGIFPR